MLGRYGFIWNRKFGDSKSRVLAFLRGVVIRPNDFSLYMDQSTLGNWADMERHMGRKRQPHVRKLGVLYMYGLEG